MWSEAAVNILNKVLSSGFAHFAVSFAAFLPGKFVFLAAIPHCPDAYTQTMFIHQMLCSLFERSGIVVCQKSDDSSLSGW